MKQPLEGLRVLEVARLMPAALVSRWLGDLGAEVLKVEAAGHGDHMRRMPPYVNGRGLMQVLTDAGKASLELDLKSDQGAKELRQLAGVADIVVEGGRPRASGQVFLDVPELRRERPQIIVCSVTGFGLNGPLATTPSHGMTIDTAAGVADVRPTNGRCQLQGALASTIGVEIGVLNAVIGVLAAVMTVRSGGEGQWLDISLWDAAVEANRINIALAHLGGDKRLVMGDQGPLYSVYACSDKRLVMFGAIEEKFWRCFCHTVGREDLLGRWDGQGEIGFGEAAVAEELSVIFSQRTASEWGRIFKEEGVPINEVWDADDVVRHAHFESRGLIDGYIGESGVPNIASPVRRADSGRRLGSDRGSAPSLGEDGREVARRWLSAP